MKTAKILILLLLLTFILPTQSVQAAANASLYFSPSAGTIYVGQKFHVFVYVGSPQSSNAYDVKISSSKLTITGISVAGSICKLYPSAPSYTPSSAHFMCGLPTPGYTGSAGYIGAVIVQGNSPGTGTLSISGSSEVRANDGAGTQILGSTGSATFTIQPPPTATPTISSSTHPNQDKWYKKRDVSLSWSGNGTQFSYTFDKNYATTPDETSEGSETVKTYKNVSDGMWYFHVRVKGSGGWSATAHYRVQIDTTPPLPFTPEADPKEMADKPPIIGFAAIDKTSGIDHYELRIDGGDWKIVKNPYQLNRISSGNHKIDVKAVDKAGNERIGSVEFSVKDVPVPIIDLPKDGSFIPYSAVLLIRGRVSPGYEVEIFLDGNRIATVKADKNGNFELKYEKLIKAGKHSLYALAITPNNIESKKSAEASFTVDPRAFTIAGLTIPGTLLIVFLSCLILFLILILLWNTIKSRQFRKRVEKSLKELGEEIEGDLDNTKVNKAVEEEITEEIDEVDSKLIGDKRNLISQFIGIFKKGSSKKN